MARKKTLSYLMEQSRLAADKVGSGFIQDDELKAYINSSACELYDLLVSAYGNDYFRASYAFSTSGNTSAYDLPADFYKMIGLDYIIGSQEALTLKPFQFNERNRYRQGTYWNAITGAAGPRYNIANDQIIFMPVPDGVYSMELWYVPACPVLSASGDEFDGINGWEEFIIVDSAIKMLGKEESDTSLLERRRNALVKRIEEMKENRDAGLSFRVSDVNHFDGYTDGYFRGE